MKPLVQTAGAELIFTWESLGVDATVDVLREDVDAVWAEITVSTATRQHLLQRRVNLMASRSRADLVRELTKRGAGHPWDDILEQLCAMTIKARREAPPEVDLAEDPPDEDLFLDNAGLIAAGSLTYFYGPGDALKSFTALGLMAAFARSTPLAGIRSLVPDIRPAFLDFEDRETIAQGRLRAIARGLGIERPHLPYFRMPASLPDAMRWLHPWVVRSGVNLLLVDSYIPAAGVDPERAEATQRLARAIRGLGPNVSTIVVTHLSKAEIQSRAARPFGSIVNENQARSTVLFSVGDDDNEDAEDGEPEDGTRPPTTTRTAVLLTPRKQNYGRRRPIALEVEITGVPGRHPNVVRFSRTTIRSNMALAERAGGPVLLEAVLSAAKVPLPVKEIAEAAGLTEEAARSILRRYTKKFVQVTKGGFLDGKPQRSAWALRDHHDDPKEGGRE